MIEMKKLTLVTLMAFCALAGVAVGEERPRSIDALREEIREASRAFSAAYVTNDVETITALYTDDALLLPPGRDVRGREAAGEYFSWRGSYRQLSHAMQSEELVIRDDIAIDVGTWHSTGQRGDAPPTSASGRYLVVWVKEGDGAWRMKYDMWHRPVPTPERTESAE